ncbi:ATP-binding protein [Paratractidigestivibacter sp.]|uniref:AlbA family DNA-binding domain-containing protein n=1 Tax=Paratractidigestivibacter sp. TaxID=2847316 RepID=UPI002AC8ACD4|nr:ATP-binding protein [Paratractidigestivibacter sp.]
MNTPRYVDDDTLGQVVSELASLHREGSYWDFKREWHENKADLLHDIICLANNVGGETGLMIIGIDEDNDFGVYDIDLHCEGRKDTQGLNDFLSSKHWAGAFPLVRVVPVHLDRGCVDVVVIDHDDAAVPYHLMEDYGAGKETVRAGAIYTRLQDGNVAKNGTATPLDTEKLWRRRFGLDKTPVERLPQLLSEPAKWHHTKSSLPFGEYGGGYCYYHEEFPEFTLVRTDDPDKDAWEPFMLASPFCHGPNWWTARLYYHQTLLCEVPGAYSDHLWIPAPKWAFLRESGVRSWQKDAYMYTYFIEGSIERSLMLFELDESKEGPHQCEEEVQLLGKLVPVFESESERAGFEHWATRDWQELVARLGSGERWRRVPVGPGDDRCRWCEVERMASESEVIVRMLDEYRSAAV